MSLHMYDVLQSMSLGVYMHLMPTLFYEPSQFIYYLFSMKNS